MPTGAPLGIAKSRAVIPSDEFYVALNASGLPEVCLEGPGGLRLRQQSFAEQNGLVAGIVVSDTFDHLLGSVVWSFYC